MSSDQISLSANKPEHPIAVVADRTGLSRDVLRVWERRYDAVSPSRSAGGQRLYSDANIERFRLLSAATQHGRSIGQVAALSNERLAALIAEDEAESRLTVRGEDKTEPVTGLPGESQAVKTETGPTPVQNLPVAPSDETSQAHALHTQHAAVVARLYELTQQMDSAGLDRELRRAITTSGLPVALEVIIPGLMHSIGNDWKHRRLGIAEEHLASAAVLAVVSDAIRAVPDTGSGPRLLVATPSGERHGLGAALVAATAALEGWSIIQLGIDLPAQEIVAAAATTQARAVALSVVHAGNPAQTREQLLEVRAGLPANVVLILGGAAVMQWRGALDLPGVHVCENLVSLRAVLSSQNQ